MQLPFTREQFFDVFGMFNSSTWVFIVLFYAAAIFLLIFTYKNNKKASKWNSLFLAILWMWMGTTYHIAFFSNINKAAYVFGALFIIQATLFFIYGFIKEKISYSFKKNLRSYVGIFFIIFGLALYPLIGLIVGHTYPNMPLFGAPCPSAIFTFGMLLLTDKFKKYLLIIPSIWAVIGFVAAISLGVPQDYMLLLSAIVTDILILYKRKT